MNGIVTNQLVTYLERFRKSWIGVPRYWRGTTPPADHCWANGDFIAFADWPELKVVHDAGGFEGMLMAWDADAETQAANLGQWRPDAAEPTGLYTPNLGGQFLHSWAPGDSQAGKFNAAGAPGISGFASGLLMSVTPDSGGALNLYAATGPDVQTISTTPANAWGYIDFKASGSNSVYGAAATIMPQSVEQPVIIYLGRPAAV